MFEFDQSVIKHSLAYFELDFTVSALCGVGSILVLHLGHEWGNTLATFERQGLLPSH